MFNSVEMKTMLGLQHKLNSIIRGPEYLKENLPYYRASWVEAGELMDHLSYKFWKHSPANYAQAQLELVDIWHFILSELLLNSYNRFRRIGVSVSDEDLILNSEREYQTIYSTRKYMDQQFKHMTDLEVVEEFVRLNLNSRALGDTMCSPIAVFGILCDRLQLSADSLYYQYISKNVLNIFRQENGYKDGTYKKNNWGPDRNQEDNEYLSGIMSAAKKLGISNEELASYVETQLSLGYSQVNTQPLD